MNNTWITDLVLRDLGGEDIGLRSRYYSEVHKAIFQNSLPIYENRYPQWGRTQTMIAKIFWDWGAYWSVNTLLFVNNGLTNIQLLKKISNGPTALLSRYGELSLQMQNLFSDFAPHDNGDLVNRYTDPFDLAFLKAFQEGIVEKQIDYETLHATIIKNIGILEGMAAECFRLMSNHVYGTPMDMEVDPYTMSLHGNRQLTSPNSVMIGRDAFMAEEMMHMWLYPVREAVMA
jgi:hypothetical protein